LKRALSESPALLLDFDGVLCDSTRECFVIVQLVTNCVDGELDPGDHTLQVGALLSTRPSGRFWEYFAAHRAYVRWPREYLLVLDAFGDGTSASPLTQRDFDDREAEAPETGDRFQRLFLECRSFLRDQYYKQWLTLFDPFYDAIEAAKELSARFETRILTGRDAASVIEILQVGGWVVPEARVFDASRYRNKEEGLEAIRAELGADRRYVLLDDNIKHLSALAASGVAPYWATWGYTTPSHDRIARTVANLVRVKRTNWREVVADELARC
jgi:phosphoglycolate phosphatase-like HAD superfamily hydrolase